MFSSCFGWQRRCESAIALRLLKDARIDWEEDSLGESIDNNGDIIEAAHMGDKKAGPPKIETC